MEFYHHGANRLGTNSLVDILVFGRRARRDMARFAREADLMPLPADPLDGSARDLTRGLAGDGSESPTRVSEDLRQLMDAQISVFRTGTVLKDALDKIYVFRERYQRTRLDDRGQVFNQNLLEAFETGCLLDPVCPEGAHVLGEV